MLSGNIIDKHRYIWYAGGLYPFGTPFVPDDIIKVYVTGKNTSTIPVRLGLYWVVWDPSGGAPNVENLTLEEETPANGVYTGRGSSFILSSRGTYTIDIILYGYSETTDKWEELDTWSGTLCRSPYTDIVEIVAPDTATPGEAVSVVAKVKNIHPVGTIVVAVNGTATGAELVFESVGYYVPYGEIASFSGSFIMPDHDVDVHVYSWYRMPSGEWLQDNESSVTVTKVENGPKLVTNHFYPLAATYYGTVEECEFVFSLGPEQIPGTDWLRDLIINTFEGKVTEEGAHMIKLQVYEDTDPVWHTDYKVIATATASPLLWNAIIIGVLAILLLVVINFTINNIRSFIWGEPGVPNGGIAGELGSTFGLMIVMVIIVMMMSMMSGLTARPQIEKG